MKSENCFNEKYFIYDGYYYNDNSNKFNESNTILYINGNKIDYVNNYNFPIGNSLIKLKANSLVTNMSLMFYYCTCLTRICFFSFDTKKVNNMSNMFTYCNKLTSLDLSSFDTKNVTDMSHMFENCTNLISLNISSFDTRNVTNMNKMFCGCKSIQVLDLSSFDMSNIKDNNYNYMFSHCNNLKKIIIKKINSSYINQKVLKYDYIEAKIKYI